MHQLTIDLSYQTARRGDGTLDSLDVAAREALASEYFQERAARQPSEWPQTSRSLISYPKILNIIGWLIVFTGLAIFLVSLPEGEVLRVWFEQFFGSQLPAGTQWFGLVAGYGMLIIGGLTIRRAGKLDLPDADTLLAVDRRRPVLLLRSFRDDDLLFSRVETGPGSMRIDTHVRFEQALMDQFRNVGPPIGIGLPGEPQPRFGVARNYYSDEEWQRAVLDWMEAAQLIVVVPGLSKGVQWELQQIVLGDHFSKTVILLPPVRRNWLYRDDGERSKRLAALRTLFAELDVTEPEAIQDAERVLAIFFTRSREAVSILGNTSLADDFERAFKIAAARQAIRGA